MFKGVGIARSSSSVARWFSSSAPVFANEKAMKTQKQKKRFTVLKKKYTSDPSLHPLYMEVPLALRYLRSAAVGKPGESATVSIHTVAIPEKGSIPLSGLITLPNPLKEMKILAITSDPKIQQQCLEAGASAAGGVELLESLHDGKIPVDFDRAFATPEMVAPLGRFARFLGPKGLFPSVKKETVAEDIVGLITENQGAFPFRQKGYALSIPVGRCDFTDKQILENLKAASEAIYKEQKKNKGKAVVLGQTYLTCTHSPGIVIDFRTHL